MPDIENQSPVVKLALKVVPGAAQSTIAGWLGNELKVRVSAPPEKGKANSAVEKLIALQLNLPKSAVRIVAGHGSARKTLEVTGLPASVIMRKLGESGIG